MCDIDHVRADVASAALRAVPVPPASTTFAAAAQRFDDNAVTAVEDAMGVLIARWFKVMPARRRDQLSACRPSIDLDGTDIEVYGKQKQGVAYNYAGQKVGRAHPATWAETGLVLAADLGSGVDDPRPQAPGLITRAIANLPAGLPRPRVRADAGYFDAKVAHAAVAAGADFGIAAKRNTATWRAVAAVHEAAWEDCWDMHAAQVADCGYVPAGWPEGTRCVVRRVRVDPGEIRSDPRSRRRRTIRPDQLALALEGEATEIYAYSFIVTNLTGEPRSIEHWFRERAWIEERHKTPNSATACSTSPPARFVSTGSGCGPPTWPPTCRCSPKTSATSTLTAGRTANGHAGSCSRCPPESPATPGASSSASLSALPTPRSAPPGNTSEHSPPPSRADRPATPRPPPTWAPPEPTDHPTINQRARAALKRPIEATPHTHQQPSQTLTPRSTTYPRI